MRKKEPALRLVMLGLASYFCKAALQGAKLNVLINTKIMKDEDLKNKDENELKEIERIGLAKADQIYQDVEKMLIS